MFSLLRIIIAIGIAGVFSRCLFDSSLVVAVCVFWYIMGIPLGELKGISIKLSVNKKIFLAILVGIGIIFVVLGKVVYHQEILVIIGAMLVTLMALIIVSDASDIVDKIKAGFWL